MKKTTAILLTFLFLFGMLLPVSAEQIGTTYYVDSVNGNDAAPGTSPETAWKTTEHASENIYTAGDRILLKAGCIFNGTFTAKGNGTAENPVIVGAYGDAEKDGLPLLRCDTPECVLLYLHNVSGWMVENLEFTAPDGHGVFICADSGVIATDITVRDCVFHDISNRPLTARYPIMLSSSGETARLRRVTLRDCSIYDCGYAITMSGLSREWTPELYVSPEESYNSQFLIEGMTIGNILYDGIIIMSVYDLTIRNCAVLNTCLLDDHYTAPVWAHHASNFVVENCEIAGSANEKDGMTVDFDGWVTDSTYQYIYSHDNICFVRNCCYDNYTCNRNCTVRYCLSVNDNKDRNSFAQLLSSGDFAYQEDEYAETMDNFKFYNNTIINASEMGLIGLKNAVIANNIFVGNLKSAFLLARKSKGENGETIIHEFDGTITNNCFWGTAVPMSADNNFICNPCFTGNDESDKNSYRLSVNSSLLGAGIKVEDDMGAYDLYGNTLTDSINIGCYGGAGENEQVEVTVFDTMKMFFNTVLGIVYNFFYSLSDRYWLF